jgi:hypothetical protein
LQRRVIVNIERLVLKGFRYEDRHAIAAAVQAELMRVLSAPETAQRLTELGYVPRICIGNVNVGSNAQPQQVGSETGRAIGKGLTK